MKEPAKRAIVLKTTVARFAGFVFLNDPPGAYAPGYACRVLRTLYADLFVAETLDGIESRSFAGRPNAED
jgi:hypothetical protein